jgi:hypothetical protein
VDSNDFQHSEKGSGARIVCSKYKDCKRAAATHEKDIAGCLCGKRQHPLRAHKALIKRYLQYINMYFYSLYGDS